MNFEKITITKTEKRGFTVICDDKFASFLGADEALGVIASVFFGENPIFLKTTEEHYDKTLPYFLAEEHDENAKRLCCDSHSKVLADVEIKTVKRAFSGA